MNAAGSFVLETDAAVGYLFPSFFTFLVRFFNDGQFRMLVGHR